MFAKGMVSAWTSETLPRSELLDRARTPIDTLSLYQLAQTVIHV